MRRSWQQTACGAGVLVALVSAAGCNPLTEGVEFKQHFPVPTATASTQSTPPAAAAPTGAVSARVLDLKGLEDLLAAQRGKVIVMDCWSTSCVPCLQEFPNLVKLHERHGPEKVACVSVSFDYEGLGKPEDVLPDVEKFLREQRAAFANVVATDPDAVYAKYQFPSIPAVFVFDREGKLLKRFDNSDPKQPPFSYAAVEKLVDELLAAQP